MSHTRITSTGASARQVHTLIRGTAASMGGKRRGPDRHVRRDSVDIDDPRARVWSPIGDGTKRGGLRWVDAMVRTAKEYDVVHRKPGTRGPITPYGVRVLEELLKLPDFKTGRLDPSIDTIQKRTGFARPTVVRALARLKAHGFLNWIRRSRKTGNDGAFGPQREQASNAYFFDLGELMRKAGRRVFLRFRQLLGHREAAARVRGDLPPLPPPSTPQAGVPTNPELAAALARVGALVDSASS